MVKEWFRDDVEVVLALDFSDVTPHLPLYSFPVQGRQTSLFSPSSLPKLVHFVEVLNILQLTRTVCRTYKVSFQTLRKCWIGERCVC
jgi:hypothetical protein